MDTNAYANNDVAFIPTKISDFFPSPLNDVVLQSVSVLDLSAQSQAIDLIFFNKSIAIGNANAVLSPTDADVLSAICGQQSILAADYKSLVNSSFAHVGNIWKNLKPSGESSDVWVAGVIRSGTPTYTAAAINLTFGLERS